MIMPTVQKAVAKKLITSCTSMSSVYVTAGGALVRELNERQDEPVQCGGAEGEEEAESVLPLGDAGGAVTRDVQAQHDGTHG
jgi:hypothetical protein